MAKIWYQQAVFSVTPGRFDNSGWIMMFRAFKNSVFRRMDTNQEMTVYELRKLCSVSQNNTAVTNILVKIVFLARSSLHLGNEPDLVNLRTNLRLLPVKQQQTEVYRMQYTIEFEPNRMKKRHIALLRILCRQLKLKLLHAQYLLPVHYHHHLDTRKLHRCIPIIVKKLPLPHDVQAYILWLTKIVKKKAMKITQPKYLNHKRQLKDFNETPWEHCSECIQPTALWEMAPREQVPSTDGIQCISTFPAKHKPLLSRCHALNYSCQTHPFTLRSKTWKVAKEGISILIKSLPENHIITPEIQNTLSRYCVMSRMDRNKANKNLAIITSADVNKVTNTLKNFCVEPHDKNKGEIYIACPFMAWHLIKQTYDWSGNNPQYELIHNQTPFSIIAAMSTSWSLLNKGLKSKLPPLL